MKTLLMTMITVSMLLTYPLNNNAPSKVNDNHDESDIVIENQQLLDEIELISIVTVAEAEGESELGKRLVIDTILNRIDSEYFPDSVYAVVYQRAAFSSVWNGRMDRCVVTDNIRDLVKEELTSRTNSEVVFFRTERYSKYGTPLFKEGHHFFSKY